jgi:hypothetical protein
MADQTEIRECPPLELRAEFQAKTFDPEKRTVDLVWTTGARVRRGFWEPFDEELSLESKHVRMARLESGAAPLLDNHSSYGGVRSILGVIESAKIDGKRGTATVRFSDREDVAGVVRDVQNGILKNVSVGYRVHKMVKVEDGDGQVPVMRAIDWEPFEVSLVLIPADAGATVRSGETAASNPCLILTRGEPPQMERSTMDETEKRAAELKAAEEKRQADIKAEREAAVKAERERASAIRLAVRQAKLDPTAAEKLIDAGVSVDAARAQILEQLADRSDEIVTAPAHIQVGEADADKAARGMTAWLLEKAGARGLLEQAAVKDPAKFKGVETDGGEFRGMSLMDMARECLERRGVKTRGMDRMKLAGMALGLVRGGPVGGLAGISDFPVLLETTMNKMLLAAYATQSDTWSRFCKTDTVNDFRAANRYRTGSFDGLDALNEHGEFKNKSIPDGAKYQISATTKGNVIGVTRQLLINDDMGALSNLSVMLGRAARLQIEKDVYAMLASNAGLGPTLADGLTLFHASHGNITTGAALSVDALDTDRVAMKQQMDLSSNEYLDLSPAILVCPVALGGPARVINQAQYDVSVSSKFQVPNKVAGLFRDIVDTPRLSGTRRYLFAEPGTVPVFVVAFLEGQGEGPMLDQQQGFRVDGIEWKVRMDYGVQAADYKGAITNAGA